MNRDEHEIGPEPAVVINLRARLRELDTQHAAERAQYHQERQAWAATKKAQIERGDRLKAERDQARTELEAVQRELAGVMQAAVADGRTVNIDLREAYEALKLAQARLGGQSLQRDTALAQVAMLRGVTTRLLDGLENGHMNALYGWARDALSATADLARWLDDKLTEARALEASAWARALGAKVGDFESMLGSLTDDGRVGLVEDGAFVARVRAESAARIERLTAALRVAVQRLDTGVDLANQIRRELHDANQQAPVGEQREEACSQAVRDLGYFVPETADLRTALAPSGDGVGREGRHAERRAAEGVGAPNVGRHLSQPRRIEDGREGRPSHGELPPVLVAGIDSEGGPRMKPDLKAIRAQALNRLKQRPKDRWATTAALALCAYAEQLEAQLTDARAKALEEAAQLVLGGSFLHAQAPTAQFAREVAAMLRRHVAASPAEPWDYSDGDGGLESAEPSGGTR